MASLLVQVKAKMAIYAHEKVRGVLEGEYGSVFKGRSMDFDDLREYTLGDDIKDIDWKATARSGQTLIRRYVAVRKHNILLVVDTGRNMSAVTSTGDSKKSTVVMLAGVIGTLALKHGDFIGMVAGNSERNYYLPLKSDRVHLEQLLQKIDVSVQYDAPKSNLASQLEFVARNLRRKMMVIVISDEVSFDDQLRVLVRRLRAQHEMLWLIVSDADLSQADTLEDIESYELLPEYLRTHPEVCAAYIASEASTSQEFQKALSRLAISSERVNSEAETVRKVFRLLERHKSGRRA